MKFLRRFIFLFSSTLSLMATDFELNQLVLDANKTDKQLLLFFHKDGCGFCEKMEFNLEDNNISLLIKKDFIFVDINKDDDETISFEEYNGTTKGFLKKLDVDLYPTIAFLNGSGEFIYEVVGYRNKKKFSNILYYIQNKLHTKITFEEFEDELLTNDE